MRRAAIFTYGVLSYALFFATFLYLIGFLTGIAVPKSINGEASGSMGLAILVNAGLLGLFAVQHSVMARQGFKKWITRFIPAEAERSTYVLASSVCLIALFILWQPMSGSLWSVESDVGRIALQGLCLAGVGLVLYSTLLIDHFDLFGLRQVFLALKKRPYTDHAFRTPSLYRLVRHPLYVGWLVTIWATPTMTAGHMLLAATLTVYILVAIVLEERDLVSHFGSRYEEYQQSTPMLIPLKRRSAAPRRRRSTRPAGA